MKELALENTKLLEALALWDEVNKTAEENDHKYSESLREWLNKYHVIGRDEEWELGKKMSKVQDIREYVDNYFYRKVDGEVHVPLSEEEIHG